MHTTHSLTVSCSIYWGACMPHMPPAMHSPLSYTPPYHACPPTMHAPAMHAPLPCTPSATHAPRNACPPTHHVPCMSPCHTHSVMHAPPRNAMHTMHATLCFGHVCQFMKLLAMIFWWTTFFSNHYLPWCPYGLSLSMRQIIMATMKVVPRMVYHSSMVKGVRKDQGSKLCSLVPSRIPICRSR